MSASLRVGVRVDRGLTQRLALVEVGRCVVVCLKLDDAAQGFLPVLDLVVEFRCKFGVANGELLKRLHSGLFGIDEQLFLREVTL